MLVKQPMRELHAAEYRARSSSENKHGRTSKARDVAVSPVHSGRSDDDGTEYVMRIRPVVSYRPISGHTQRRIDLPGNSGSLDRSGGWRFIRTSLCVCSIKLASDASFLRRP